VAAQQRTILAGFQDEGSGHGDGFQRRLARGWAAS
jgi:hypothetical protein